MNKYKRVMNTFTEEEFEVQAFISKEPLVLNTEFLNKWLDVVCINSPDYHFELTPVEWAAKHGYLDAVHYLVENDPDVMSIEGIYVGEFASRNGHLPVVKYLVENGIHEIASDTLHQAVFGGHLDVVKYLVEKGADITARDFYTIYCAVEYNHLDIVKYLLSTCIYPEELIHEIDGDIDEIHELLTNYVQFPNTKSVKK